MPKNLSARMCKLVEANRRKHYREFAKIINRYNYKNTGRNYGDIKGNNK